MTGDNQDTAVPPIEIFAPVMATGLAEPGDSAALVGAISGPGNGPGGLTIERLVPLAPGDLTERVIQADQTNFSVIVGDRAVVKWMRPEAPDRAPRMLGHLAAAGFTRMPAPHAFAYRDGRLAAIVAGFLPGAVDGWEWCVDELLADLAGGAPADFAPGIGTLAAELHAALATPSGTYPRPVAEIANPGWTGAALAVLSEVRELAEEAGDDDGRWFSAHSGQLAADIAASARVDRAHVVHLHGDLHVGQVLKWQGGYAVTDFDGNPALAGPAMEPLARDVAQLRTSLLHVGEIANRRTAGAYRERVLEWGSRSQDALLDAYTAGLSACGMAELFDAALLRPFEVEQECRELLYAAKFSPRWRYAPMGVLRSWYS